ncbi:MAG: heparinase II/III family protein [Caulobacteraceae bacterium]
MRGRRHENDGAAWLEFNHDGWARDYGVTHERRLYLDQAADELRGEDLLMAIETPAEPPKKRPTFLIARFQLHPETKASLAMDHKSGAAAGRQERRLVVAQRRARGAAGARRAPGRGPPAAVPAGDHARAGPPRRDGAAALEAERHRKLARKLDDSGARP